MSLLATAAQEEDARCGLCLGATGESKKGYPSKHMILLPVDVPTPSTFDGARRVRLPCGHSAHAECVVTCLRARRLQFLHRFMKTILSYEDEQLSDLMRQCLVNNAWFGDSIPFVTCRICSEEHECTSDALIDICCVWGQHGKS